MSDCEHLVQEKKRTRIKVKQKQCLLAEDNVIGASDLIAEKLLNMPELLRADIVFCYISIKGEVQTRSIIERLLATGKKVCVPKCDRRGVMDARFISSIDNLKPCEPFGILEPDGNAEIVDPHRIDFAVVPGLAFDSNGNRLGRGAGYYDRYLGLSRALKCGICFDEMLLSRVPVCEHDIPMDIVVTEKNTYRIEKTEGFNG